ncbi:MAG: hypothetical protein WCC90_09780 [Methylocella sp.]
MAKRGVQITLVNNTPFTLTYYQDMLCHGDYNTGRPPDTVEPNSVVQWGSHDSYISFEGTEGWVKYTCIYNSTAELVFIYWNNPYFLQDVQPPAPFYRNTFISDVDTNTQGHTSSPYCSTSTPLVWPNNSGFSNSKPGTQTITELFDITNPGTNPPAYAGSGGALAWNIIVAWPVILASLTGDVNLSFTIGLGQKNSVGQRIRHFYDGTKGLRALAVKAQQPSLRKLFGM